MVRYLVRSIYLPACDLRPAGLHCALLYSHHDPACAPPSCILPRYTGHAVQRLHFFDVLLIPADPVFLPPLTAEIPRRCIRPPVAPPTRQAIASGLNQPCFLLSSNTRTRSSQDTKSSSLLHDTNSPRRRTPRAGVPGRSYSTVLVPALSTLHLHILRHHPSPPSSDKLFSTPQTLSRHHGWPIRSRRPATATADLPWLRPAHLFRVFDFLRGIRVLEFGRHLHRPGAAACRGPALLALRQVRRDRHALPGQRGFAGRQS